MAALSFLMITVLIKIKNYLDWFPNYIEAMAKAIKVKKSLRCHKKNIDR